MDAPQACKRAVMNFLMDANLPATDALFGSFAELNFFSGREIPANLLAQAEVLLVRSTTQINASVIAQAPHLRFVGTATIGTEHIDQPLLARHGIKFSNAPGCNAAAVAEYVLAAILVPQVRKERDWRGKRAVIIGAGNTGSATGERLSALGMQVTYVDPFLARQGDPRSFASIAIIQEADLVSLHVPYTRAGCYPTHHLLDATRLRSMRSDVVLVNASRGAVIDNQALFTLLQKSHGTVVLDVWENEPEVMAPLVPYITLATPHIAGHSLEGKIRGSYQLYDFLWSACAFTGKKISLSEVMPQVYENRGFWSVACTAKNWIDQVAEAVLSVYDPRIDDTQFRMHGLTSKGFDGMRKQYQSRRELSMLHYSAPSDQANRLRALGFTVESD